MSAADGDALQSHRAELIASARIYGYDLTAGNWTYEQARCAPMPQMVLLRYRRDFGDGTESMLTALVPRGPGRVRIVPVLHRNATPFVPAPRNPANYALFNDLVADAVTAEGIPSDRLRLQLSACYAEMTGGSVAANFGSNEGIGIAGAPTVTIHLDVLSKTSRVMFSTREGAATYRVWSVSFNRHGRITSATTFDEPTEDRSLIAGDRMPQGHLAPEPSQLGQTIPQSSAMQAPTAEVSPQPSFAAAARAPEATPPSPASASSLPSAAPSPSPVSTAALAPLAASRQPAAGEPSSQPGWRYKLHPAAPHSRIILSAPPPREKVTPPPPDPWSNPGNSSDEPPQ